MSNFENKSETCTPSKVVKLNDQAGENELDAAVNRNQEQQSPIFKMHAIACEDFFEYLSLEDLYSLGQTCKRFKRLTGLYFQQNFGKESTRLETLRNDTRILYNPNSIDISAFNQYIESINVCSGEFDHLQYIELNCSSIKKVMVIDRFKELTTSSINALKKTLAKVEYVDFHDNGNNPICESLIELCTNMKSLRLSYTNLSNNWFHQKHPFLEHIAFPHGSNDDVDLKSFLELNPSINSLQIDAELMIKRGESLMTTNATLNELSVVCHYFGNLETLIILLNDLHHRGFYKCLSVIFSNLYDGNIHLIPKILAIKKLGLGHFEENIVLPSIPTVKEVDFDAQVHVNIDVKKLMASAANLERVIVFEPSFEQIKLMMQELPKLKEIIPTHNKELNTISDNTLDILALNHARKTLKKAHKVIIYLKECVYLPTKWKFGHQEFDLVEIRRAGSLPMEH